MRPRVLALVISIAIGVPVLVALGISLSGTGESEVRAPEGRIEWPAALSGLSAPVTDMAVDSESNLWFLMLTPPQDQGEAAANTLVRYDQSTQSLDEIPLPADDVSPFIARIEAGKGARSGMVLVAWESTLLEVNTTTREIKRLDVPLDVNRIETGPEPPTTRIYDIAVDEDGSVWISRDHYPYLIAMDAQGIHKEFALPSEAGTPERLAVDGQGHIWATLIRHQPFSNGPGLPPTNSHRLTLRFNLETAQADVLPIETWNVAGAGEVVVALAGDAPANVQRLDAESGPITLTDFGSAVPGAEMAVGPEGDVWYRSRSVGLVRIDATGTLGTVSLPSQTGGNLSDTFCVPHPDYPQACEGDVELDTPVLTIAVAPDGSAWFSTGDRIGHAIP